MCCRKSTPWAGRSRDVGVRSGFAEYTRAFSKVCVMVLVRRRRTRNISGNHTSPADIECCLVRFPVPQSVVLNSLLFEDNRMSSSSWRPTPMQAVANLLYLWMKLIGPNQAPSAYVLSRRPHQTRYISSGSSGTASYHLFLGDIATHNFS